MIDLEFGALKPRINTRALVQSRVKKRLGKIRLLRRSVALTGTALIFQENS